MTAYLCSPGRNKKRLKCKCNCGFCPNLNEVDSNSLELTIEYDLTNLNLALEKSIIVTSETDLQPEDQLSEDELEKTSNS